MVLVSSKISCGEKNYKYFVGYLYDNYKIKPLHINLLKTSACVKSCVFFIKNNDLPNKYNPIWHKVSTDIKKKFNSGPVGNKNFLKTKIKSYGDEAKNIHDQEMPKEGSNRAYLAVRSLDSVLKKDENYYSQLFLKECKCKEKKWLFTDDIKNSSVDSYNSDEE